MFEGDYSAPFSAGSCVGLVGPAVINTVLIHISSGTQLRSDAAMNMEEHINIHTHTHIHACTHITLRTFAQ